MVYLWLYTVIPGVMMRREEERGLAPLVREAKSLGLTYEKVFKHPDEAFGKPAIWCIQNRGEEGVFYEGKRDKRIFVLNEGSMPLYPGTKHSICSDMLVIIRKSSFVISGSKLVPVEFVYQFPSER